MTATEASIVFQPGHLWYYGSKLIRLRLAILVSGFRRAKPLHKILIVVLGLLVLGLFAGSYLLTTYLLRQLESPLLVESGINLDAFVDAIPALIVSVAFLVILITSFRLLLQALYLANDMDFLLAAPIPIRAVFLTKLLEAILPTFIIVMLFSLPVFFGLGSASGYRLLYFPLVIGVLALLSLAAAGISSLLVMAVVRFFPAKGVAEVLAFLGAAFLLILSQLTNLTGFKFESVSPELISQGSQFLNRLNSPWFPLAWGGRGLVDLGEGRWLSGIFFLTLTFALTSGIFWFTLNASERLYTTGWASLQVEIQHKKTRRAADRRGISVRGSQIFRRLLPPEVLAIIMKDFKELWRDLSHMSQVIGPLIAGIVFAVMLLRSGGEPPAGKGEAPALFMDLFRSALAYGSMAISLLVGWGFLARMALIAFSMEGRSYWILKTAPISAGKLLAAKFLMAYLPALILGWLYLLAIALLQNVPPSTLLYGIPSVALILAGLGGINLAFGVRGVNLTWTDPRKMESGVGGCLGMIVSVAYQAAAILLFFGPPLGLPLLGIAQATGQSIGLFAGGTIALLCTFLPLLLVKDWVSRIGEE